MSTRLSRPGTYVSRLILRLYSHDELKCTGSKTLKTGSTESYVNDTVQAFACAEQGGEELFETDGH